MAVAAHLIGATAAAPGHIGMNNARILCLCPTAPPVTGQAQVSAEAIGFFRAQGFRVVLIPKRDVTGWRRYGFYLTSLVRILAEGLRDPTPVLAYFTCSRSRGGFVRDALFIMLCRARGIPAVNHIHGSDLPALLDGAAGGLARRLLNAVHTNIALSETMADACRRSGLRRVETVPNFVPDEYFAALPDRMRAPGQAIRVLFLSNIAAAKGFFDLIEACARLQRSGTSPRFELHAVGQILENTRTAERATLARLQAALAQHAFIRWHGPLHGDAKLRAYADADIFCIPSHAEGAPLALLEAMATGLPAVASAVGSIPEIAGDGRQVLLVPSHRPDLLAEKLARLMEAPDLRHRLGDSARQHVRQHFTRHRFHQHLAMIVAAVARRRAA